MSVLFKTDASFEGGSPKYIRPAQADMQLPFTRQCIAVSVTYCRDRWPNLRPARRPKRWESRAVRLRMQVGITQGNKHSSRPKQVRGVRVCPGALTSVSRRVGLHKNPLRGRWQLKSKGRNIEYGWNRGNSIR